MNLHFKIRVSIPHYYSNDYYYYRVTSAKFVWLRGSVLFFSRPRSEGWPHHGRTFSIYFCPLSFWFTVPRGVLSTSWCCPSRPCVVSSPACTWHCSLHYLFLRVFSWCDHSMLASLLWQSLTIPSLLQLCQEPTHLFSLLSKKPAESFSVLSSQRRQNVFLHSFWVSTFTAVRCYRLSLSRIFVEIGMLWLFHIFCSDAPIACPLFNLVRNSVVHSPSSVRRYGNVTTCSKRRGKQLV